MPKINNLKDFRDDCSKYPKELSVELRGILNYLEEAYASSDTDAEVILLPEKRIDFPNLYSDTAIRTIMRELLGEDDVLIISSFEFKTVHY